MDTMDIVLASCSERRKFVFSKIFKEYKTKSSNVVEILSKDKNPNQALKISSINAQKKSDSIARSTPDHSLVIGCDTVIVSPKAILGKPTCTNEAIDMLIDLSGKTHSAITYVSMVETNNFITIKKQIFCDLTKITFNPISKSDIVKYVEKFNPLDKDSAKERF